MGAERTIKAPILVFTDRKPSTVDKVEPKIAVESTPTPTAADLLREEVQAATEDVNKTTNDDWANSGSWD